MSAVNKPAGASIRLSQCMIVKNEEKNIERALTWAKGIAFEQIVVDTGSTDRTVEIAERMGAKVFHFKWIDDFSAAKNFAIDQASGDWIAFLDADEYVSEEHARLIIPLIENNVNFYGKNAFAFNSQLAQLRDDGSISEIDRQQRFFINHPDLRYERPIHETLRFPEEAYALVENDILIAHTGYTHSAHINTGKIDRNMAILKKAVESDPEDVKSKYYLADVHYASCNYTDAITLYRDVLNRTDCNKCAFEWFRIHAFYHLINLLNNKKVYDEAYALAEQAFHEFPERVNFCYLYGTVMYTKGRFEAALDAFKKAEKLVEDGKIENQKLDNIDALPIFLAQTYAKLDNHAEALRYAVSYLQSHKQREDALKLCIQLIRLKENPENTVGFLSILYDFKNVQNKMLLLRCAKDMGDIVLAQFLVQMN